MKVTVIGSHLCPDTLYALNRLVEAKADIDFKNLSASLPDLKAYLALRESSPVFDGPKARGSWASPALSWRTAPSPWSWRRFWADSIRYRYRNKQRPPGFRRALCCR